ncbi:hypothetical protein [Pseudopontixanthobacter vadosimaris]|uniref:hypothetical protein n=1 Tax=Pseudopontixanthobacter vadosimaris TaxID=2726450 RepID=UPI001472D95B|nr:hypothetical protein [Pseudopontixanthobacter vadosimaris]
MAGQTAALAQEAASVVTDEALDAITLPREQLEGMLLMVALRTNTVGQSLAVSGVSAHCERFVPIFETTVSNNLPEWSAKLRAAYRDNVPNDVLAQAMNQDPQAAALTLAPYAEIVGGQMQAEAAPLLKSTGVDLLATLSEVTPDTDLKQVDQAARQAEIMKAAQDGRIFCGLMPSPAGSSQN